MRSLSHRIIPAIVTGCVMLFSIPAYSQVGGSGTQNYLPKWLTSTTIGNSQFFDNGHVGFGTTSPNFAGYGGNSKVLTINSPGGTAGLGVLELTTDRTPTNGMEIGDVATSLSYNTSLVNRRISRILTYAAGTAVNNRGGVLSFQTKQDGITGYPVERLRITDAGNVGIGTSAPGSKLSVSGRVESMSGGFKFPDGTTQTTAASSPWATSGTNIYNTNSGGVGIGTSTLGTAKLAVEGKIEAREVVVTTASPFPDFVFEAGYQLPPLESVEKGIKSAGHLPGFPSAGEVGKAGLDLGKMQLKLVQKTEEIMLYLIQLQKENDDLKARLASLSGRADR